MKTNSPGYVLLFMVAICLVFGTGIAAVHYLTLERMRLNDEMLFNRKVCEAFSLSVKDTKPQSYIDAVASNLVESRLVAGKGDSIRLFTRTDSSAIGFFFSGVGFWDVISGILVLSPNLDTVRSIKFLEQFETPGLGARIEEAWFTDQFRGYAINWQKGGEELVVLGTSPDPSLKKLDAIAGASQTSMAVSRSVNQALASFRATYQGVR